MIGTAHRTLPELAAFANSVASRFIEGNDTYPGGGGHPSDCLLPILAVAQASGASAQTAITAIVLGYEVHRYLFRAFPMRKHALDYVLYNAVSSAAGAAKVLGLSLEQTAQRHRARRGAQSRHRHQPPRPSHHVEGLRRRQRGAERRVRRDHGEGGHGRRRRRRSRTG